MNSNDDDLSNGLSRRERQVVELLMRYGTSTAREIEERLADPPTYSAVRSILRLLVEKGLVQKELKDGRDLFRLPVAPAKARAKALQSLVGKFFDNSVGEAAVALLGSRKTKLSDEEADRLLKLINDARMH